MKKLVFEIYRDQNGKAPFEEFLGSLPAKDAAKLVGVVKKTEEYGLQIAERQKWVKKLRNGLFELRSNHGGNVQRGLYFHAEGDRYVITHGFTKKTNRTPPGEIDRAERLMKLWQHRNRKDNDELC